MAPRALRHRHQVPTTRQDSESFSRRAPPLGSGWLHLAADGYDFEASGNGNQVPGTRISGTRISHPDIKTRISEIAGLDAQDRPL
jgi:hypothetical protein